ncbi:MAG: Rpn family recombination-promoting nuclease/putative transposase [Synergistaceae bacterium]|jgi:predicted transposase/invertase (TIGR01784 family)|nr:Rpn family recombination-promoting nuclease/putative transposase [Synergistaceae bacterium]
MNESIDEEYLEESYSTELDELIPKTRDDAVERLKQGNLFRLLDSIVKFLLARPESEEICRDFLNAVIFPESRKEFVNIELLDRNLSPARLRGRGSRIDLYGTTDDGSKVNVEIQLSYDAAHASRAVYYWSLVHTNQLESGDLYKDVDRTVSVNLLGFDMLKLEKNFCNTYSIRNDGSSRVLTDDLKIIFIELPKFIRELRKPGRKLKTKLEKWLCFFVGLEGEFMPDIAEAEPVVELALKQEQIFLMDERMRMAYIDDLMDMYSERKRGARAQKLARDRHELAEENRKHEQRERKAAIKLLELGMSIGEIAATMGLPESDVRNYIA